jgi:hypothetical protein
MSVVRIRAVDPDAAALPAAQVDAGTRTRSSTMKSAWVRGDTSIAETQARPGCCRALRRRRRLDAALDH